MQPSRPRSQPRRRERQGYPPSLEKHLHQEASKGERGAWSWRRGGPGSRQHVRRPLCGLAGAPAPPGGRSLSRGHAASWGGSRGSERPAQDGSGDPSGCTHMCADVHVCAHVCVLASGLSTPRGCFTGRQRHASLRPPCPRAHVFSMFGDKVLQPDRRQAAASWLASLSGARLHSRSPQGARVGGAAREVPGTCPESGGDASPREGPTHPDRYSTEYGPRAWGPELR